MAGSEKVSQGSKPIYGIRSEKDVFVSVRDGVKLAVDIFRPDAEGKFPALLAYGQYGKELEEMALTFPPQARPSNLWDGGIEGGDTKYIVLRGYVHLVADARGTGKSEGECCGFIGTGGDWEGKDCHDLIEWIAQQPWCDGNVGMAGAVVIGFAIPFASWEKSHIYMEFLLDRLTGRQRSVRDRSREMGGGRPVRIGKLQEQYGEKGL